MAGARPERLHPERPGGRSNNAELPVLERLRAESEKEGGVTVANGARAMRGSIARAILARRQTRAGG
jgi:hypothetical protein